MALRISEDAPVGLASLRTGAAEALGPEQSMPGVTDLAPTAPAVTVPGDNMLGELLFVIGLAVLAGLIFKSAEEKP